jgi:hypothetical protein
MSALTFDADNETAIVGMWNSQSSCVVCEAKFSTKYK